MNKLAFRTVILLIFFVLGCWIALRGGLDPSNSDLILWQIRLPRLILAIAVGASLSLSGLVLQAVFANPICEPYTLGISSGAALGAVIGFSLGNFWSLFGVSLTGFFGALIFTLALYLVSHLKKISQTQLLLVGVMLSFLGSSLVAVWMALADPNGVQGAVFWLMGDLSRAQLESAWIIFGLAFCASCALGWYSRSLDVLLLGEESSQALGLDLFQVRSRLLFLASLLVGLCVSTAGMIGFVGLMVPHFSRKIFGSLHRRAIPGTVLLGATVLTWSDWLSRNAAPPLELPVGVITALVGAPLFIFLFIKRGSSQ